VSGVFLRKKIWPHNIEVYWIRDIPEEVTLLTLSSLREKKKKRTTPAVIEIYRLDVFVGFFFLFSFLFDFLETYFAIGGRRVRISVF